MSVVLSIALIGSFNGACFGGLSALQIIFVELHQSLINDLGNKIYKYVHLTNCVYMAICILLWIHRATPELNSDF